MNSPCSLTYVSRMGKATHGSKAFPSISFWQHTLLLGRGLSQHCGMLHPPDSSTHCAFSFCRQLLWKHNVMLLWIDSFPEWFQDSSSCLFPALLSHCKGVHWLWDRGTAGLHLCKQPSLVLVLHPEMGNSLIMMETENLCIPSPLSIKRFKTEIWEYFWITEAILRAKPYSNVKFYWLNLFFSHNY